MDTRQRIIEIAYDEFSEKGFEKTALSTISDKLGITRPALYYHFPSKEDLFLAVYNSIFPGADYDISEALAATDTASYRMALDNTIHGVISHYRSDTKRTQFMAHVQHAGLYLPSVIEAAQAQDERLREALRAVLLHGVEIGCLRKGFDVEVGINYLTVAIYGIGEVMLRGSDANVSALMPLFFDGLFG